MLAILAVALAAPQAPVYQVRTNEEVRVWAEGGASGTFSAGANSVPFHGLVEFPPVDQTYGVRLDRLGAVARISYAADVHAAAYSSPFAEIRVESENPGAVYGCGSTCLIGSDSPWYLGGQVETGTVSQGQSTHVRLNFGFDGLGGSASRLGMSDLEWRLVESHPTYEISGDLYFRWAATHPMYGNSQDVALQGFDVSVTTDIEAEATYELLPAGDVTYCTSQPGVSGEAATLEAYGSLDEGSEFFAVVADGVPAGSAGILFAGTLPANQPLATATLCVGGTVTRVGGIRFESQGRLQFDLDLANAYVGEQLFFQCVHRDPLIDLAATDAIMVEVR